MGLARQAEGLCVLPEFLCLCLNIVSRKNTADYGESRHLAALELPDIVSCDSADCDDRNGDALTDLLKICRIHGLRIFFRGSAENRTAAEIVRTGLLRSLCLLNRSGRDADNGIRAKNLPCLGRSHVALAHMYTFRANLPGQHDIIVDEKRHSVFTADSKDFPGLPLKCLAFELLLP